MALFSTLMSPSANDESSSNSSSSSIPTVIQLYTSNALNLDDAAAKASAHAVMSFQAVEVGGPNSTTTANEAAALFGHKKPQKTDQNENPNLGIWNCRVVPNGGVSSNLVDRLLLVPNGASAVPAYCFTVDLSDPSQVEPTMSLLQEALVRHLIQNPPSPSSALPTATTTLYQLRSSQFGLAPEDDKSKAGNVPADEEDKEVKITLMICAIVPLASSSDNSSDAYRDKQAQALVLYHLRRYAASVNATICLVRSPSSPTEEGAAAAEGSEEEQTSTMMVDQVAHTWRQLASGGALIAGEEEPESLDNQETAAALYGPGAHQEDLIETVLLRNAQYPGHWDASKDSLWVALPPSSVEQRNKDVAENAVNKAGDDEWLSQLRDSIGSLVGTAEGAVEKKTQKAGAKAKQQEQPEDAAVSSFFENLLKKP